MLARLRRVPFAVQVLLGLVIGIALGLVARAMGPVSGSFVDYTLPTAADTISFVSEHTTSPSTTNTLGTKGVGEAGTIASTPAVVNAIVDAVRHFGIDDIQMPCTPERVWKAIQGGGAAAGHASEHAKEHFAPGRPNQDTSAGAADGDPGSTTATGGLS